EAAKQIEAIRQEQGMLAKETEQLQEQSRLAQESMAASEQMKAEKLTKEAENLAAEQRAMSGSAQEKLPPELKAKLDKLADEQADLARRVQPFAENNQGPDVKSAAAAAEALKKPRIDDAIAQQKEHEKQLQEWRNKLAPAAAANSLRDQILQLLMKQQAIRGHLEQLVKDVDRLELAMLEKRLRELTKREKDLSGAVGKLAIDAKDEKAIAARKTVEKTTQQAAQQLAIENAGGAAEAHRLMRKAEQELQALADLLPKMAAAEPKDIKDP